MKKKLVFLVTVVAFCFVIAGCAKSEQTTNKESKTLLETTLESQEESTVEAEKAKEYVKEDPSIETPVSVVEGVTSLGKEDGFYKYDLGNAESNATMRMMVYSGYLMEDCGLTIEDADGSGSMYSVSKDGKIIIVFGIGKEDDYYWLMLKFV